MTRRATIVGAGPNGLTAAVVLARLGYAVRVLEASDAPGGGARTGALTLPGFRHDLGSAVHPGAVASPVFAALGVTGAVDWLTPEISYAHAIAPGRSALAWRDIERTAHALDADERAWLAMLRPLARHAEAVAGFTGDQLLRVPADPVVAARFGARALELAAGRGLRTPAARALMWGVMAHANTRTPSLGAAGGGLLLGAQGHALGWPVPRGGAQAITDALLARLAEAGGTVATGIHVRTLQDLDWGDARRGDLLLLDTSPRLLLSHPDLPSSYLRAVQRFPYGPAVAKVDLALSGPVPWADPALADAVTVHVGGSAAEVERAEADVARGRVPRHPYVIAVQPSVLDPGRAPAGSAVLWAYAHVPNGSTADPAGFVIDRLEHFAPGLRDRVLAVHGTPASAREAQNPAAIGGDISGGAFSMRQAVVRPVLSRHPWRTPLPGVYLCSASTPPGPAVHGRNGWLAARLAVQDATRRRLTLDDVRERTSPARSQRGV